MPPWFTESVRYKVVLAAAVGLLTALAAYFVERSLEDDAIKAALGAVLDAAVVILVGTVITALLDHRAVERARRLERDRQAAVHAQLLEQRAAVRAQLLSRLGPNLKLAAWGWVHRPGLSAPSDEDLSVAAGRQELELGVRELRGIEADLKRAHETSLSDGSFRGMAVWLPMVQQPAGRYWFEGGRAIRFRHLSGIREALPLELGDADDVLRGRFAAFAGALDLAEAAKMKTDLVIQQHLVVSPAGEPAVFLSMAHHPDVARVLRSVAVTAPVDGVLHLAVLAGVLWKRALELDDEPPDGWAQEVHKLVDRCVGALEHEVANAQMTLLRLIELVDALWPDDLPTGAAAPAAREHSMTGSAPS